MKKIVVSTNKNKIASVYEFVSYLIIPILFLLSNIFAPTSNKYYQLFLANFIILFCLILLDIIICKKINYKFVIYILIVILFYTLTVFFYSSHVSGYSDPPLIRTYYFGLIKFLPNINAGGRGQLRYSFDCSLIISLFFLFYNILIFYIERKQRKNLEK